MTGTLIKKSFRDLSRRKTRSFFTIATIALGVMGISLFAVTPLADKEVLTAIREERMHNIEIQVSDVVLNDTNVEELGSLENVKAMEPRVELYARMYIGERRSWAQIVGIRDYGNQSVDKVLLVSGDFPGSNEVLTDKMNSGNGVYNGKKGDDIEIIDSSGDRRTVRISGTGRSLLSLGETTDGVAVFYTDEGTARSIGNISGYNSLRFTLDRTDSDSMERTTEVIRSYLTNNTSVIAFGELPDYRPEDYYEGKETLEDYQTFLSIFTFLILFCSVFLISNTMNTTISEQKKEISQMKTIGGTKLQIFRSYLTTSFVMGAVGSLIGAVLGTLVAYFVVDAMGEPFGFQPTFSIHLPTVSLSILVGIGVVIIASIPALVRSSRMPILEGLGTYGISTSYGLRSVEAALMRIRFLPRSAQIGIRNANRKTGRSIATVFQIALAVGVLLALGSIGSSIFQAVEGNWKDQRWDLAVYVEYKPSDPMTMEKGNSMFGSIGGIGSAEPFIVTWGDVEGNKGQIYGMVQDPSSLNFRHTLLEKGEGRWWTEDEETDREFVAVMGFALSRESGVKLNDEVDIMTATGLFTFRIIGIDRTNWDDGLNIRVPLTTLQELLKVGSGVSGFYLQTVSGEHRDIDGTAESIYNVFEEEGYILEIGIHYVLEEEDRNENQDLLNIFTAICIIVVMISLIGLMSTLTMNVLDRTREIGMLRCIGAGSRSVLMVFGSEGVFISFIGWVIGVPLGYGLYEFLLYEVEEVMSLDLPWSFQPSFVIFSFVITVLGTLVVILAPLMRAVSFKPGEALRYE
ncbi:MAG: FtsX-like permease family protein [Thermoplasmatota archaeon]